MVVGRSARKTSLRSSRFPGREAVLTAAASFFVRQREEREEREGGEKKGEEEEKKRKNSGRTFSQSTRKSNRTASSAACFRGQLRGGEWRGKFQAPSTPRHTCPLSGEGKKEGKKR